MKFEGDWPKILSRSSYRWSRIDWYDSVKIYVFQDYTHNWRHALNSYIDTHVEDPDVKHFFSFSEKRRERKKIERIQALANFNINELCVIPGTSWAIILEYAGLTTDERPEDKWDLPRTQDEVERNGVAQQRFQLFCYIREGPGTDAGDNSRHIDEFVGLPTSNQIEE